MRWLVHGTVMPAALEAMKRHEQEVRTPGEVALGEGAPPAEIFEAARKAQLDILTTDAGLAQAPFESPVRFGRTMVFLNVETGDVEQDDAIDRLFTRYKRLSPGRLYTVTGARVKVRQMPKH